MTLPNRSHTRRTFLKGSAGAAGAGMLGLAGCIGGSGSGGANTVTVPGLYDISGPTSDVGKPTAVGSRDAIKWLNENEPLDRTIDHPWTDYAYDVPQAKQAFDKWTSGDDPPIIIGWGTADTEALSGAVARKKIVYISASYSANLTTSEAPYNFIGNLDYTSQARIHLKWIKENDPGAKISFIFSNTAFGKSPVEGGKKYAKNLGLEVGPDLILPLTATSAKSQLRKAKNNNIDYLVHQNTTAPMQVLMSDQKQVYPEVTVCGLTYTMDEYVVQQSPDIFEGARYVNAFEVFDGAAGGDGLGARVINESFEREGRSKTDYAVANLNYVRGVIHALLAMRGLQNTIDAGNDPTNGADVRQGMFDITDWNVGGLAEPFDYMEGDKRPTMNGQTFEAISGKMQFDTTIDLPRKEKWLGL